MPIIKNNVGLELILGIGDVVIMRGCRQGNECENILMFKQDYQTNPLYEKIPAKRYEREFKGKNTDEVPVELIIEFASVNDIDALVNDLNKLRAIMLKEWEDAESK